ncbi:2-keto-4-pentenoate hydratase [Alteribacillus persepolensis]|uniref:2-keto-4-pentenoate hydratase n=1 Tax=Alteribacillus persepolensis TaxID=568899 RepID=A0A1G8EDQ9_9BACI|nr:fumarylacetoacetate hydrolase family protein [Alteribacillus persepolensis]SDH68043.1 2-keto-4-pentenoate hydratase [Alteribacillus persepolensis]
MTTKYANISDLSQKLYDAEMTGKSIKPLVDFWPEMTVDDAYYIQLENIKRKKQEGQQVMGKKIGLTSKPMQELLGVNEPDYGHLLNTMQVKNGEKVPKGKLLQPKVEGEIAFVLDKTLQGPNVTMEEVLNATRYVLPAIEIVDSRVQEWKITLKDTVADNASSGLYVLGDEPVEPHKYDLSELGMVLYRNGNVINRGAGLEALGHPAICVAWLANRLSHFNISLEAGEVILSGALSKAIEGQEGDLFEVEVENLGTVSVNL